MRHASDKAYPFSLLQEWFITTLKIEDDPLIVNFYIRKAEALQLLEQVIIDDKVHFRIPNSTRFIRWTELMSASRGNH